MTRKKFKNRKSDSNIEASSELSPCVNSARDKCNYESSISGDRCSSKSSSKK